ncbi:MAG: tetratricopeptide repeat protein [Pyrinomonadaceae bacterium]|nr:tetratricopeptide repeat protein [Pyrinomonadaceae bacterium]
MFRKSYFTLLLAVALFSVGGISAFAQAGMARGIVELKKAEGAGVPLADVVIDIYRTDILGKLPSAKTNKKGEFTILGFLPGARYALAVSAPNIRADVFPDIKAGDEKLTITVIEGDGKAFTEQQVRQLLTTTPKDTPPAKMTEAQKKELAELEKKNAAILENNKKVENANAVVNRSLSEGTKAFGEKNYDLAISKFDEGINADPDFEGSAPVLLNNKSAALLNRAILKYNTAIKGDPSGKAAALESVKKDLSESVAASNKSLQILKAATNTDAKVQKAYGVEKIRSYQNAIDGYTKMFSMNIDSTKGKEALTILEEYTALETDAAKKSQWQLILADGFRQAGNSADAVIAYRKVIEVTPDNPDALAGLGLSLFSVGAGTVPENTAQMQEGLNYMQRFADIAPETHPLKASVKEVVEYLKTKQLAPQKTTKPTKKKT